MHDPVLECNLYFHTYPSYSHPQDLQAQALLDYEEQFARDAQEFQAQTRERTPLDSKPQEEVTSEAPEEVETTTEAEVTTTAPATTTTTESTIDYEYEYDSDDASERTLTLARNKREASVLLYPTTLQTTFVPAYFSDEPDRQVGKSRTKRQVCMTPLSDVCSLDGRSSIIREFRAGAKLLASGPYQSQPVLICKDSVKMKTKTG